MTDQPAHAIPARPGPRAAPAWLRFPRTARRGGAPCAACLPAAAMLAASLLAATAPARAQPGAAPSGPPAASGATTTPPDIVKPRTAGPGDTAAGIIRPGPSGDAHIHVPPPPGESFPTPVIKPQTLQGGAPVVPR